MFALFVHPKAKTELIKMMQHLEKERRGYGLKFFQAYKSAEGVIRQFPKSAILFKKDCRQFKLEKFSVIVVYRFENNKVEVLKFIHAARRPSRRL